MRQEDGGRGTRDEGRRLLQLDQPQTERDWISQFEEASMQLMAHHLGVPKHCSTSRF